VIVGLVALSTILVLVLADEDNRIAAEQEEQQAAQIERATANYLSLCMACHGPAGLGYTAGDGRIGFPLNTTENQQGVNAEGTPVSGGMEGRADLLRTTIHEGRGAMPAWGEENSGPLNSEQIEELVVFIQHVDWNHVYNEAIEESGGYPTVAPTAGPETPESEQPSEPNTYNVALHDNFFEPADLVVPANTDITLNLTNEGVSVHTFDIDELGVDSGEIAAGETKTLTFNTGGAAEYQYYCAIPGHKEAGMVGTFTVTDDPSLLPQPATATGGGDQGASTPEASAAGGTTFEIEMVDIAFTQTELHVPANTEITINLVNNGASTHTFDIVELGVDSGEYASGQTGSVTFNTGEPGTYQYYCAIPGHKEAGMVGTLIVE
jgi:plastocyanin/mono/diheme cytochrome c family protein